MQKKIFLPIAFLMLAIFAGCRAETPAIAPVALETPSTPEVLTSPETTSVENQPVAISPDFTPFAIPKIIPAAMIPGYPVPDKGSQPMFSFFEIGTINVAPYKDWSLVLLDAECDGMCFRSYAYRLAWDKSNKKIVHLTQYMDKEEEEMSPEIQALLKNNDDRTTLAGLELPERIRIPNTNQFLHLGVHDLMYSYYSDSSKNGALQSVFQDRLVGSKVAFTDPVVGNVYFSDGDGKDGSGCFYVQAVDGTISRYEFDPKFFDDVVTWNDNSAESLGERYQYISGGCGVQGNCYVVVPDVNEKNLTLAGTTSRGIKMYTPELRDGEKKIIQDQYNQYSSIFEYSSKEKPGAKKMTMAAFLKTKPILYWQDPLGRWSYLVSRDTQLPAECGKPVIYLYPTHEMDVRVGVDIDHFTKTIPDYGRDGWFVKASPSGQLLNYADGQNYPYLFWEGMSKKSVSADRGFVISRTEISSFLKENLGKMGLNDSEKKDFMDFWVPRMMKNPEPYVFVSFLGTRDFNHVAPLNITPKPDTLIRVFMYYQPVNTRFTPIPQDFRSIARKGFTVIEWGGTSSSAWQY